MMHVTHGLPLWGPDRQKTRVADLAALDALVQEASATPWVGPFLLDRECFSSQRSVTRDVAIDWAETERAALLRVECNR